MAMARGTQPQPATAGINNLADLEDAPHATNLLLPANLWGEVKKNNNTLEEAQFLENQLSHVEQSWGSDQAEHSIFDVRTSQNNTNSYTAATTPVTSTTPPIPHFNPLAMNSNNIPSKHSAAQNNNNNNNNNINSFNANATQLGSNALLQNYQQQQQHLEQLQQQQQCLQNPLFLQQQAQIVSQQLQQLQLQLQLHQQQIETANNLLLAKRQDQQPLTQENLTKLEGVPSEQQQHLLQQQQQQQNPAVTSSSVNAKIEGGSHTSEEKVNTELYKTELCSTFQRTGNCPYGTKCQFAHGHHELKHVDRGSKWRSKACANWTKTGTCRYGSRCCFRHGD
jgi:hypothetical protein